MIHSIDRSLLLTDDPPSSHHSGPSPGHQTRPLPVAIAPGMQVIEMTGEVAGTIVGFTEAFCIYKTEPLGSLSVISWRDAALGPICPAAPLLPDDVAENDRRNASATVLREFLALKQFGLTPAQAAVCDELVDYLRS